MVGKQEVSQLADKVESNFRIARHSGAILSGSNDLPCALAVLLVIRASRRL
jgi:hypothetical protein